MVSTNMVCRSCQSVTFTHYQQKPSQHAFVDNAYCRDTQIKRWLHLLSRLWEISLENFPSLWHVQRKNRPKTKKISFDSNKQLNYISCSTVCKLFFCSEFPDIPEKFGRKKRKRQFQSLLLYKQTENIKKLQVLETLLSENLHSDHGMCKKGMSLFCPGLMKCVYLKRQIQDSCII